MILIELNKKHYEIPQSWNELTAKQLLQVMDILFLKNYDGAQQLLKLLQVLTGMSHYRFFKCDLDQLQQYFYRLAFLVNGEDYEFTKNHLPFYEHDGVVFYGPDDAAKNIRMSEFEYADYLIIEWLEDKNKIEVLNELIAVLYRPAKEGYDFEKNPDGDPREIFNDNLAKYYAKKHMQHWPLNLKLAIVYWYNGCRQQIIKNNPEVFEGGNGDPALYGMASVMLNIAESGVFGKFQEVEGVYVNIVMMQLNEIVNKAKKLEKQNK